MFLDADPSPVFLDVALCAAPLSQPRRPAAATNPAKRRVVRLNQWGDEDEDGGVRLGDIAPMSHEALERHRQLQLRAEQQAFEDTERTRHEAAMQAAYASARNMFAPRECAPGIVVDPLPCMSV